MEKKIDASWDSIYKTLKELYQMLDDEVFEAALKEHNKLPNLEV